MKQARIKVKQRRRIGNDPREVRMCRVEQVVMLTCHDRGWHFELGLLGVDPPVAEVLGIQFPQIGPKTEVLLGRDVQAVWESGRNADLADWEVLWGHVNQVLLRAIRLGCYVRCGSGFARPERFLHYWQAVRWERDSPELQAALTTSASPSARLRTR